MKLSTRELAILAVFGALWGLVEISLGAALKTLNIPLSGTLLAAIGLAVALTARVFVPRRGSTLFVGAIAMLLKLFSLGGAVLGPMVGILTEALLAEVVLTLEGQPRRRAVILAGILGVIWVLVQPFITGPLLFGRTVFVVWLDFLDRSSRMLGLQPAAAFWIVLVLLIIHVAVGGLVGWISWDIAKMLQIRLGRMTMNTL